MSLYEVTDFRITSQYTNCAEPNDEYLEEMTENEKIYHEFAMARTIAYSKLRIGSTIRLYEGDQIAAIFTHNTQEQS